MRGVAKRFRREECRDRRAVHSTNEVLTGARAALIRSGIMLEQNSIREALSVLVPLIGEACAYDSISVDGTRSRVVALHQNRLAEDALAGTTTCPATATTVSVRVAGVTVGEVVVWRHDAMNAVEEALVVVTAERIAAEIEKAAMQRREPSASAALHRGALVDGGELYTLGLGVELVLATTGAASDHVPRAWLLQHRTAVERAAQQLMNLVDSVREASLAPDERSMLPSGRAPSRDLPVDASSLRAEG